MTSYAEQVENDLRDMLEDDNGFSFSWCDIDALTGGGAHYGRLSEALYSWGADHDGVTGAPSGSYYCNAYAARCDVLENIEEVARAYGATGDYEAFARDIAGGAFEEMDVTARLFSLYTASARVAREMMLYLCEHEADLAASGEIER